MSGDGAPGVGAVVLVQGLLLSLVSLVVTGPLAWRLLRSRRSRTRPPRHPAPIGRPTGRHVFTPDEIDDITEAVAHRLAAPDADHWIRTGVHRPWPPPESPRP